LRSHPFSLAVSTANRLQCRQNEVGPGILSSQRRILFRAVLIAFSGVSRLWPLADVLLHWHGSALSVQAVILQSVSGAATSGDRNALTKMNCFMLDLKWQFLPSDDLVWSGVVRGVPVGSTIGIAWLVESNWRPDCRAPQTPPLHESQVRVCSPHFTHWPGCHMGRFHTAISTV
jgi:hypothetical protein